MLDRKHKIYFYLIALFSFASLFLSSFFLYKVSELQKKNQNLLNQIKEEKKNILETQQKIKTQKTELKIQKEKIKAQFQEIENERKRLEELKKELEEKEKIITKKQRWNRLGILPYHLGFRIFDDENYPEININKNYRNFFVIVKVQPKDTYTKILARVFGKDWYQLDSTTRHALEDLAEKINRLDRKYLSDKYQLVIPTSTNVLDYSPFSQTLSDDFLKIADQKRREKIKYYWNGFGSEYGNQQFQKRTTKPYSHILLVNLKNQYFGIYQNGVLKDWGPVSTSDPEHTTPKGYYISLWYHPDWYSKTYEAEMKNAVNFDPAGYFTHTGAILGSPRSHGCIRMLDRDSKKVYDIATEEVFPIIIQ